MAALLTRRASSFPVLLRRAPFSALPEPLEPPEQAEQPPAAAAASSTSPSSPISRIQRVILAEPDPDRVAELFLSGSHLRRFHASRPLFSLAVLKLTRARRPDLVRRLLDPLLTDRRSPKSEGFLARILSLYSSAGLPDAAANAFRLPSPHPRSDLSLSALLSALLHNRRFSDVKYTFERAFSEFGITPGLVSHNVLLSGLCENGEVDDARKVLDEMANKENRPEPDIISYNTVLAGYLKKGDGDGFEEILKEINERGFDPNVVTFNCRISRFCAKGESFKAEELLDTMISMGIQPNLSTFNTLVNGFCKEGLLSDAVRVFKKMKVMKRKNRADGVPLNSDTYIALMRCLVEKEKFEDAVWICKECLARKCAPPFEVMKGLVDGLVQEGKIEEAMGVVSKMRLVVNGDAKDAWDRFEGALSLQQEATESEASSSVER